MPLLNTAYSPGRSADLYYEDLGAGRALVFLHDWLTASASWDRQLPALAAAGLRVIAHDRRGSGRSGMTLGHCNLDSHADDLHRLLSVLDLQEVVLVGHGMGAAEIVRYLGTYGAERVARAALISPSPHLLLGRSARSPKGTGGAIAGWRDELILDRHAFLRRYIDAFYNADELRGSLISESALQAAWNQASDTSMVSALSALDAWTTGFSDDVQRIEVPLMVIQGTADRIHGPASSASLVDQTLPGTQVILVENAPHGLQWTHAVQVNAALLRFSVW